MFALLFKYIHFYIENKRSKHTDKIENQYIANRLRHIRHSKVNRTHMLDTGKKDQVRSNIHKNCRFLKSVTH